MTNRMWLTSKTNHELAIMYCVHAIPGFSFFGTSQQEDTVRNLEHWLRENQPGTNDSNRIVLLNLTDLALAKFYCKWAMSSFGIFSEEQKNAIYTTIVTWLRAEHKE